MKNQQVRRFYDTIANDYDRMISFEKRLDIEEPKFRKLVEKYSITSALDAGAGSGFHSVLLARCGVQVTAVDISGEMLRKLEQNAKDQNLIIKTVKSDFIKLPLPTPSFDAVICLGNSLVHIPTIAHLKKAITNFAKLLNPGGIMILQILNYDRVMKQKERLQSIKKSGDNLYIRYYEFHKKHILFNLLTINAETLRHELHSVLIKPIMSSEIKNIIKNSGFVKIQSYGDLALNPFLKGVSHDLVITANKR
jgi:glycine/sarcosine N-methyltransferase